MAPKNPRMAEIVHQVPNQLGNELKQKSGVFLKLQEKSEQLTLDGSLISYPEKSYISDNIRSENVW